MWSVVRRRTIVSNIVQSLGCELKIGEGALLTGDW
jgi:hypothetical protein